MDWAPWQDCVQAPDRTELGREGPHRDGLVSPHRPRHGDDPDKELQELEQQRQDQPDDDHLLLQDGAQRWPHWLSGVQSRQRFELSLKETEYYSFRWNCLRKLWLMNNSYD